MRSPWTTGVSTTTNCYGCDKTVRSPVMMFCSKNGVRFTVELHKACVEAYKRSLARFGSKIEA